MPLRDAASNAHNKSLLHGGFRFKLIGYSFLSRSARLRFGMIFNGFLPRFFLLYSKIYFFAVNGYCFWRGDAEANLIASYIDNRYFHVVAYHYRFISCSAQYQHCPALLSPGSGSIPFIINTKTSGPVFPDIFCFKRLFIRLPYA